MNTGGGNNRTGKTVPYQKCTSFSPGEQSIVLLREKKSYFVLSPNWELSGKREIICESELYLGEFYLGLKLVDLVG